MLPQAETLFPCRSRVQPMYLGGFGIMLVNTKRHRRVGAYPLTKISACHMVRRPCITLGTRIEIGCLWCERIWAAMVTCAQ